MAKYNSTCELLSVLPDPICSSLASVVAALELLVALSSRCVANMKLLTSMLTEMFFSGTKFVAFIFALEVRVMSVFLLSI